MRLRLSVLRLRQVSFKWRCHGCVKCATAPCATAPPPTLPAPRSKSGFVRMWRMAPARSASRCRAASCGISSKRAAPWSRACGRRRGRQCRSPSTRMRPIARRWEASHRSAARARAWVRRSAGRSTLLCPAPPTGSAPSPQSADLSLVSDEKWRDLELSRKVRISGEEHQIRMLYGSPLLQALELEPWSPRMELEREGFAP